MKTILEFAVNSRNCKTLNLSIVGFGERDRIYQLLVQTKKLLSELFALQPFVFYNMRTLSKAEGNPSLLQKKATLDELRISKTYFTREYVGFAQQYKDAELYEHLFSSCSDRAFFWNNIPAPAPYYTVNILSSIVHEKFGQLDYDEESTFADVSLEIAHEPLPSGKSFARVNCKIGAYVCEGSIGDYTNQFQNVVNTLDLLFPDALHSAYISLNYPSMAIARQRVYRHYDPEMLERYILGAEWFIYINDRIPFVREVVENMEEFFAVEKTKNGIAFTAKTNIAEFSGDHRRKISHILEDFLIPACGEYNWSCLCNQTWRVCDLPRRIDVFSSEYSVCDPIVVFSHNYDISHLCEMLKISPENRIASFALK